MDKRKEDVTDAKAKRESKFVIRKLLPCQVSPLAQHSAQRPTETPSFHQQDKIAVLEQATGTESDSRH